MGKRRVNRSGFSTRAVHAGKGVRVSERPHVVPIYQTVNFEYPDFDTLIRIGQEKKPGYFYSRYGNPTVDALNSAVAELEGGDAAFAFASGMAAITSSLSALVRPGDHVVASAFLYGGAYHFLSKFLPSLGTGVTFVDPFDRRALERGFRKNTRVVFAEPLINPTLGVVDIRAWSDAARRHGAFFLVDNTFTPPPLFQPLAWGVDGIVHSTTKFIEGHGDTLGGIAVGSRRWISRVRAVGKVLGGTMAPFAAWLTLRGLRTLPVRLEKACSNAAALALFLQAHPAVVRVHYPGLADHSQRGLAEKQFSRPGAMVAFEIPGGIPSVRRFCNALRVITPTVSLGEVDTIVSHPATSSHAALGPEARKRCGITDGLLRLSVGIEDTADLTGDVEQALKKIKRHGVA
jgi:methionine-gamma-lyase